MKSQRADSCVHQDMSVSLMVKSEKGRDTYKVEMDKIVLPFPVSQ